MIKRSCDFFAEVTTLTNLEAISIVIMTCNVFDCNVTSHKHLFKSSCDFMVESPSFYVTTLLTLVDSKIAVVEIKGENLSRDPKRSRL